MVRTYDIEESQFLTILGVMTRASVKDVFLVPDTSVKVVFLVPYGNPYPVDHQKRIVCCNGKAKRFITSIYTVCSISEHATGTVFFSSFFFINKINLLLFCLWI